MALSFVPGLGSKGIRQLMARYGSPKEIFVACKNEDSPKDSRKVCIKACVGCSLCVRGLDEGLMTMENNLARIDYHLYGQNHGLPTEKCPTQAVILIESVPEVELLQT